MSWGNLLCNDILKVLYQEARGHDIECRSKNFWQNLLIQQFSYAQGYTLNSEVSPDGVSRTRVNLSVGLVSEG